MLSLPAVLLAALMASRRLTVGPSVSTVTVVGLNRASAVVLTRMTAGGQRASRNSSHGRNLTRGARRVGWVSRNRSRSQDVRRLLIGNSSREWGSMRARGAAARVPTRAGGAGRGAAAHAHVGAHGRRTRSGTGTNQFAEDKLQDLDRHVGLGDDGAGVRCQRPVPDRAGWQRGAGPGARRAWRRTPGPCGLKSRPRR